MSINPVIRSKLKAFFFYPFADPIGKLDVYLRVTKDNVSKK